MEPYNWADEAIDLPLRPDDMRMGLKELTMLMAFMGIVAMVTWLLIVA